MALSRTVVERLYLTWTPAGETTFQAVPIVGWQATFARNAIPAATVTMPVSNRTRHGSAELERFAARLEELRRGDRLDVEVWGVFSGEASPGRKWRPGPQRLFRGRVSGRQRRVAADQQFLAVSIRHWLDDLRVGSAMNGALHASAAAAVTGYMNFNLNSGVEQRATLATHAGGAAMRSLLPNDPWGAIKGFVGALASQGMKLPSLGPQPALARALERGGSNPRVLQALAGIEGPCHGAPAAAKAYASSRPWPLAADLVPGVATSTIADYVGDVLAADAFGSSLWDLLVSYWLPGLDLCLSPWIDGAAVLPCLQGVGGHRDAFTQVHAEQALAIDGAGDLETLPGVVGLRGPFASSCGSTENVAPNSGAGRLGGLHVFSSDAANSGPVQFMDAPFWLQRVALAGVDTAQVAGVQQPAPDAANPRVDQPPARRHGETISVANRLCNAWAQLAAMRQASAGTSLVIEAAWCLAAPGTVVVAPPRAGSRDPEVAGVVASNTLAVVAAGGGHVGCQLVVDESRFPFGDLPGAHPLYGSVAGKVNWSVGDFFL